MLVTLKSLTKSELTYSIASSAGAVWGQLGDQIGTTSDVEETYSINSTASCILHPWCGEAAVPAV